MPQNPELYCRLIQKQFLHYNLQTQADRDIAPEPAKHHHRYRRFRGDGGTRHGASCQNQRDRVYQAYL